MIEVMKAEYSQMDGLGQTMIIVTVVLLVVSAISLISLLIAAYFCDSVMETVFTVIFGICIVGAFFCIRMNVARSYGIQQEHEYDLEVQEHDLEGQQEVAMEHKI